MFWASTVVIALVGAGLALWPAHARYRASAVVQVGDLKTQGLPVTTLEYDAVKATRPESIDRVIGTVDPSDVLRINVTSTASDQGTATKRVFDAITLLQRSGSIALPGQVAPRAKALTALRAAENQLRDAHQKADKADKDLAAWRAAHSGREPGPELAAAQKNLRAAQATGNANAIAAQQAKVDELTNLDNDFNALSTAYTAAQAGVGGATEKRDDAKFALQSTPPVTKGSVDSSPIAEETISEGRPPGRLSIAAILLVLAIAAADGLFLTRTKLALPEPQPRRARVPDPQPQVIAEPGQSVMPVRYRQPRRRAKRVAGSPLDLPNIEVHLLDREGGLRAIQLRDSEDDVERTQSQER